MPQDNLESDTLEGTICHFESDFWADALEWAQKEIRLFRRRLNQMSPAEVERIVGEMLSQFTACEVRHVGRSGDGGVDLLIIESDKPVAVQVKHRLSGKVKESVVPIREFLGAMVLGKYREGVFVTTAEAFTGPAMIAAQQAKRVYAPLNLVTVADLRSMIKNIAASQWEEFERLWRAVDWKVSRF